MTFLNIFAHARDQCFVTSQNVQINVCGYESNVYSYHLTRKFAQLCLNVNERFQIMTDSQTIYVVTFHFKGTGVRCVVCGSNDYQMNFILMHNFAK